MVAKFQPTFLANAASHNTQTFVYVAKAQKVNEQHCGRRWKTTIFHPSGVRRRALSAKPPRTDRQKLRTSSATSLQRGTKGLNDDAYKAFGQGSSTGCAPTIHDTHTLDKRRRDGSNKERDTFLVTESSAMR